MSKLSKIKNKHVIYIHIYLLLTWDWVGWGCGEADGGGAGDWERALWGDWLEGFTWLDGGGGGGFGGPPWFHPLCSVYRLEGWLVCVAYEFN